MEPAPVLIGMFWNCALETNLVDGTYESFQHCYAPPSEPFLASVLGLISGDAWPAATVIGHVVESRRNTL